MCALRSDLASVVHHRVGLTEQVSSSSPCHLSAPFALSELCRHRHRTERAQSHPETPVEPTCPAATMQRQGVRFPLSIICCSFRCLKGRGHNKWFPKPPLRGKHRAWSFDLQLLWISSKSLSIKNPNNFVFQRWISAFKISGWFEGLPKCRAYRHVLCSELLNLAHSLDKNNPILETARIHGSEIFQFLET